MFKDNEVLFSISTGDAPTAQTTTVSGNVWDSGPLGLPTGSGGGSSVANAGRDLGIGGEFWAEFLVLTAAVSAGGATMTFEILTDSTSTIVTKNVVVASAAFTIAQLIIGFKSRLRLPALDPASSTPYKRYISGGYLIGTSTMSAGTYESKMVLNVQAAELYSSGFAVS